jgi:hypothetical protein
MKPKLRRILEDAIEHGIKRGWHRAHKHNENPDDTTIWQEIEDGVMSELYEYFTFDEDEL